jgi:hypothetical protein
VSKALLMSRVTAIVLSGGFLWLNPVAITEFIAWSAEFVECLGLKPCCVGMLGRFGVI